MDNVIRLNEQQANELIANYLRKIADILDICIKHNEDNILAFDYTIRNGNEIKRLREISILNYIDLLKLSLKHFYDYDVFLIKQTIDNNSKTFICYQNLLKRGR